MDIRKAKVEDLEDIYALGKSVWGQETATRESLAKRIELFSAGFPVAYVEGQLVGIASSARLPAGHQVDEYYAAFYPWERVHKPGGSIFYLYSTTVHPLHRQKGIWKELIRFRIEAAKVLPGIEKVWVVGRKLPNEYGPATAPLLEKLGFSSIKEFPDGYGKTDVLLELLPPYSLDGS